MMAEAPLPRTLLFTLNHKDNYILSTLSGALQRSGVAANVNQGPAWWFHDQKEGMEKHLRELASVTPLSEFIGMTTDSRSLLSYTRHDYFRRCFCGWAGEKAARGELPGSFEELSELVKAVCCGNAKKLAQL